MEEAVDEETLKGAFIVRFLVWRLWGYKVTFYWLSTKLALSTKFKEMTINEQISEIINEWKN